MVDLKRDTIRYINEGVTIMEHRTLGLIAVLKDDHTKTSIKRALDTCNLMTNGGVRRHDDNLYIPLKEKA